MNKREIILDCIAARGTLIRSLGLKIYDLLDTAGESKDRVERN